MATAGDIILDALQMLGVYDSASPLSTADATLGLQVLNDMLDSWSNEALSTFAINHQSFPLVAGQQSYTIGSGGNINTVRPLRILEDPGTCFIRDSNNNDYPMRVIPEDVWNTIGAKYLTSDLPDTLFYDPQYPLGIINIYPIPVLPYTCFFDSYLQLASFGSTASNLSLPPGYKAALGTNLAIALKPYFADGNLDPIIVKRASETKGNIKRTNMRINLATFDPEIVARSSTSYNIYTDNYNNGSR